MNNKFFFFILIILIFLPIEFLSYLVINRINNHPIIIKSKDLFERRENNNYFNKYKKASFLLKVVTDEELYFFNNIKLNLKQIPQIYTAELIPLEGIKNKKLFLF